MKFGFLLMLINLGITHLSMTQQSTITGRIKSSEGEFLSFANIAILGTSLGTSADENGLFTLANVPPGQYKVVASYVGYEANLKKVEISEDVFIVVDFTLLTSASSLDEVVVTGTLKEVNRLESPVPVEVYSPAFFRRNPTSNMFEALQNINGVRPQLNCQVCNTGDIHINGLEGPYTMVLIDGMPIVSSLGSVYGLSGIPTALVERIEIVKGPASSLYGSEAIGGLINIITKRADKAPVLSTDVMATSWGEVNADVGIRFNPGKNVSVLTGVNYFHFDHLIDNNQDNFTDMTLQERLSIFQKWSIKRKDNRLFNLAGRYYWEDRWGGELQWTKSFRGGDQVYGEAITTQRWELMGQYQLPVKDDMFFSLSFNGHEQNSVYGNIPYRGQQNIGFGQLTWQKSLKNHELLIGSALRYTFYDDNTPATGGEATDPMNAPDEIWLPGIFVQDEITLHKRHNMLLGIRYDYNSAHGNIFTPRIAYKWSISTTDIVRVNAGTGFRVVNLFTEDHAALTGAREVVITEPLDPEQSYNINVNYIKKKYLENGGIASLELSGWYTHFTDVIFPDYETNANQIIYDNLDGSAISKGISLNADLTLSNGLSFIIGGSLMDVRKKEGDVSERQILTEQFTGTWSVSYKFLKNKLAFDYTGNVYGPMRLPILSPWDPRPDRSPWWSIQNIQISYKGTNNVELYGGVKNLLNWTPWKNQVAPIIARAFDPFDRDVVFDASGQVMPTISNPNALSFDPNYIFAPNQGIRGFLGIRYTIK